MIFLVLLGAEFFNSFIALTQLPNELGRIALGNSLSPLLIVAFILILYLFLGCLMDSLAMILLTIPVFFPLIMTLDFGMTPEETAIWFGILTLIVVEVGLITPPVGLNVFIINKLAVDVSISETFKGVLPLEIMIDSRRKNGITRLANLKRIDDFHEHILRIPELSNPISVVNLSKYIKQSFYNGNPNYYQSLSLIHI